MMACSPSLHSHTPASICVRCPSIPPAMPLPYVLLYTSCRGATQQPAEHQPPTHDPAGMARLAADTRMPPCPPLTHSGCETLNQPTQSPWCTTSNTTCQQECVVVSLHRAGLLLLLCIKAPRLPIHVCTNANTRHTKAATLACCLAAPLF